MDGGLIVKIPRLAEFIGGPIDGSMYRRVGKAFPAELMVWHQPSSHLYLASQEGSRVVYRHWGPAKAAKEQGVIS
jgi:hypothetical protein